MTKDRPKIHSSTYFGNTTTGSPTATTAITSTTTNDATVGSSDTIKHIDDIFLPLPKTNNNDDVKMVTKILAKEKGYLVAKIEKGCQTNS